MHLHTQTWLASRCPPERQRGLRAAPREREGPPSVFQVKSVDSRCPDGDPWSHLCRDVVYTRVRPLYWW